MLPRKLFRPRICECCGRQLGEKAFPLSNSPFFPDNHLPICSDCLGVECQARAARGESSWDFMEKVCQWCDIAFIPEEWTKQWETNPKGAVGRYLEIFQNRNLTTFSWKKYEEKWNKIAASGKDGEIHKDFDSARIKELTERWSNFYTSEDLYKLDKFYEGLKKSFGITDELKDDIAKKLAKISLEIDRAIQDGTDVSKLISSYNALQKTGGFTSDNAADNNNFESVSELCLFLAKNGWKRKFDNDEPKDVVDMTMRSIQAWVSRLYKSESSMADQIDARKLQKLQIERLEHDEMTDDEIENWDANADRVIDEDEPKERFQEEL